MAAPTSLRRYAVALLLALPSVGALSPAAGVEAVPAQQGGERFPEPTVTAIVGDVDGDGVRELVRLGPLPDDETHLGVEVISADREGRTTRHAMAPFRRLAGVEEQTEGPATADEDGMVAARIDEPARLLVWNLRDRERVLVASIGTQDNPRACCLTLGEVGLDGEGHTTVIERAAIPASASYILAADLDGDGTDELVVAEPPSATAPGSTPIYVLRWSGGAFDRVEGIAQIDPSAAADEQLIPLGDSDGRPGEEIGLLHDGGQAGAILARVSFAGDGTLRVEHGQIQSAGPLLAMTTSKGGRILVGTPFGAGSLLAWPAGSSRLDVELVSRARGFPASVLGSGSATRVMLLANDALEQLNDRLTPVRTTHPSPAAAVLGGGDPFAHLGPIPGGLNGAQAYVFRGGLLVELPPLSSAGRRIEERPIATMAATTPIGTFGADSLLTALAEGGLDATREGGQLIAPSGPRSGVALAAALTSTVLSSEVDDGRLEPSLTGAVVAEQGPAGPLLLTREGFSARIAAPPGSRILVIEDGATRDPAIVPRAGSLDVALPARLSQYTLKLVVITPSGHGYVANWSVRVRNEPPSLETTMASGSFGFSMPILGQTDPGTTVTVDGQAAAVASDGSFVLEVGVGLIPREVEIRAADALGNVATQRVSVVGPFDYRQLPWIPIVAALTVVAGAILYLRVPRALPAPQRSSGDDAVLEEIE